MMIAAGTEELVVAVSTGVAARPPAAFSSDAPNWSSMRPANSGPLSTRRLFGRPRSFTSASRASVTW